MLSDLKQKIDENKYIIIVLGNEPELLFFLAEALEMNNNKIEIWHSIKGTELDKHILYIELSEMNSIIKSYFLYDFSNKVFVISNSIQYGTLLNYVETGIMTRQEMVKSLLYKL